MSISLDPLVTVEFIFFFFYMRLFFVSWFSLSHQFSTVFWSFLPQKQGKGNDACDIHDYRDQRSRRYKDETA